LIAYQVQNALLKIAGFKAKNLLPIINKKKKLFAEKPLPRV